MHTDGMSTRGNSQDGGLVVELTDEQTPAPGRRRWVVPSVAVGVAVVLIGALVGLLLSRDEKEPTPTEVLAEVHEFVDEARTATFVSTAEHTFSPESGDGLGHSSTSRSRATGQFQLPDRAHVVVDEGDWAHEYVVNGKERYDRTAEGVAGLAAEKWVRWTVSDAPPDTAVDFGGPAGSAASFLAMFGEDMADFTELFDKLKNPERIAPNRVRASVPLADVVPDEVKQMIERFRQQIAEEGDEDGAMLPSFDGTLTVTVDYGAEGRLDVLLLEVDQDEGDDRAVDKEEIRFADWGQAVTILVPGVDQIDATPHIEEELLAAAQQRFTVFAPTPPAGWKLQSATVEEADAESESCESVDLQYGPGDVDVQSFDFEEGEEPPMLTVSSTEPSCQWADDYVPELESPRRVRVGGVTAQVGALAEDEYYGFFSEGSAAVLTLQGTPVVVATNLSEAELVAALRSLAPLDLSKQPIARFHP